MKNTLTLTAQLFQLIKKVIKTLIHRITNVEVLYPEFNTYFIDGKYLFNNKIIKIEHSIFQIDEEDNLKSLSEEPPKDGVKYYFPLLVN